MGEIHTFLGAPVLLHEILSRTACSECWSHFKHLRGEATFSQIVRKINLNCPHVIPNPFLILSNFFPIPQKIHWLSIARRDADETLPDLPLPAPKRFKRSAPEPEEPPSVQEVPKAELSGKMGTKSWAKWTNGGGDQTTNEDGDIVPTLSYPS